MPWQLDIELGSSLMKKYALADCYVFDIPDNEEMPLRLGASLADYFIQILPRKNAIVGLSWGNTISKFARALPYIKVENCSLVQLSGSFPDNTSTITPTEVLNMVSKKLDSRIYFIHAPLYAASEEMRDHLLNDPINNTIREMAENADINIIGLSDLSRDSNTLKSGNICEDDFKELVSMDSIGDLAGMFLDRNGDPLYWSKSNLYMGVILNHIGMARNIICVAGELRKAEIIRKTCEKKYYNILFTTKSVAKALLQ
jgi:DNA-binding transcriptional regulator LsrR (DeoR family)